MQTHLPEVLLIIDPDRRFHEFLNEDFKACVAAKPGRLFAEPLCVISIREAQRVLSMREVRLAGVFVNPSVGTPAWLSVLKDVERYYPKCPRWVVCDRLPELSDAERIRHKIQAVLQKPIGYVELNDEVDRIIFDTGKK